MLNKIKTADQFQILNINFFAYDETDAYSLMISIKKLFPENHIYVSQEKMRYYVRGLVVCSAYEPSHGYNLIFQMVKYYNCCSDDYSDLNYRMAG